MEDPCVPVILHLLRPLFLRRDLVVRLDHRKGHPLLIVDHPKAPATVVNGVVVISGLLDSTTCCNNLEDPRSVRAQAQVQRFVAEVPTVSLLV